MRSHHTLSPEEVRTSSFLYNHHICRTLAFKFPGVQVFIPSSVPSRCMVVFPATLRHISRIMQPILPQELSDMIIDYLHNDEAALRTAGLVCKSWFPESRFHLFSDIKLSVYNVHNVHNVHNNGLTEAICAEGSTIPPYILHLEIMTRGQDAKYVNLALLRLPPLCNLKSLSLGQIKWASLTGAKKCVTTMAQNITTLSLCCFTVRHPSFVLLRFISSHLLYWNSSKLLMTLSLSLRLPLVWRILCSGRSNVMIIICAIILRRQMRRP